MIIIETISFNFCSPRRVAVCVLLTLISACAQPVVMPEQQALPPLPDRGYDEGELSGSTQYRIDPGQSFVLVHVGRAGTMKSLGHDHAVASENVEGRVLLREGLAGSIADLQVPLKLLLVDDARYRQQLGLDPDVSESASAGTYSNMQSKVLETMLFPVAELHADFVSGDTQNAILDITLGLHGTSAHYQVPVVLDISPSELVASGEFVIKHADFAMTAFSALGGALRVAEDIPIQFRISARAVAMP
ncbi:MAG TPA: YceI family protein [Woeseiaceae bacterium]|nr:YceI family protein [Woeseiaceae bacterium]